MTAIVKTPVSNPKNAPTNGDKAKGAALAVVCIKYATERMAEEEKQQNKLLTICKSIAALPRDGHAEFRSQLSAELTLAKACHKAASDDGTKVSRQHTAGYSINSFTVLVSNWRTISAAVELGLSIEGKSWGQILGEAVETKNAHAAHASEGAQVPTKRKAGRKATPLIDKAVKAAEELLENNPADFVKFAAQVEKMLKALPKQA
jgi:hypothetical protein